MYYTTHPYIAFPPSTHTIDVNNHKSIENGKYSQITELMSFGYLLYFNICRID